MNDRYSLPNKKARICRVAGAMFLFLAAGSLLSVVSAAFFPGPHFYLGSQGSRVTLHPENLLEEDQRARVAGDPAALRRFNAYAGGTLVRAGVTAGSLIRDLPFALLLASVGVALRKLGGRGGQPLADALPWLRRATKAAVAAALIGPIGKTAVEAILSVGTPDGFVLPLDFTTVGTGLMLAAAAYATVWALEAGLKAQRDLDDFV